ncbi:unnamed protein product [Debaryomyces tyrocola]|nr:unnamed protein product [Debaryomyces tyrocola]
MGKHESLSSPAKSLQEKKTSESSSMAKNLQQHQQERIVNHNINRAIDSERGSSQKKEDINIRNCNDNNEHNDNNNTPVISHSSNNKKKKKRRNKTKSKNNSKTKTIGNENGLEDNEQKSKSHTDQKLNVLNIPKIDTQSAAVKTPVLTYDGKDGEQTDSRDAKQETSVLDMNLKINPPISNDQLQVSNLSPRKQTILRYKKSDDRINERSLINEAKDNLKKKKMSKTPESQCSKIDESMVSPQAGLDMDKKVTLFKYKSSRILVFDEQLNDKKTDMEKQSSGRLLGHGEFEIFQLHNGDVTYLSCGPSFVYPLLPKLKILRINFNQFILPLVNPERYWKISINSDDKHLIELLEKTLEKNVKYRNLFFGINQLSSINICEAMEQEIPKNVANDKETKQLPISEAIFNSSTGSEKHEVPVTENPLNYQFPIIFNEIPDSPPSAPLSPHNENITNVNLVTPTKNPQLLPGWSLKKKQSDQSINSAMASLDVNKESIPAGTHDRRTNLKGIFGSDKMNAPLKLNQSPKVHQPKPKRYANLPNQSSTQFQNKIHKSQDNKSDSSMDSLLDEYEDNIHTTKSITFNSRPPSRPISVASSFSRPQINYTRGSYFHGPIERDADDAVNSQYNEAFEDQIFPTTSLSEYNKTRNGGHNGGYVKSRRSSRSELYTSESNWMEPSTTAIESGQNRIMKSRNSIHDHGRPVNADVKQIYRSFTQRNLSQYTSDLKSNADSKSVKSQARKVQPTFNPVKIRSPTMGSLHRKGSYANSVTSGRTGYDSISRYSGVNELPMPIPHSKSARRDLDQPKLGNYKVKLNSSEVYKMISESRSNKNLNGIVTGSRDIKSSHETKEKPQATGGFASRLFGW